MRTRVILTACAIIIFASLVCAQDQEPSLKNKPTKSTSQTVPPLALEIHYNSTISPGYLMIQGADVKPHWMWVTRFLKLPNFAQVSASQQINAVRVTGFWNGETADVTVTLLRGPNFSNEEETVVSYHAGLDEPTIITKLENYGIEPFKITLLTPKTSAPPPPNLDNRTTSVEILKIETEALPLPAYRPTFRNLSRRDLVALQMDVMLDGAPGPSALRQGEDGAPLIPSNEVREEYINAFVPQKDGESFTPGATQANVIVISGAVFTDGTFEGHVGTACMYESLVFGRRLWLKEALKIIDEPITEPDDTKAAVQLRQKVQTIRFLRTSTNTRLLSVVSPQCSSPSGMAESTFYGLNNLFVNDIESVINKRPKPLITFTTWLEATRKRYHQWLQNLEVFPTPRVVASR